MHCPDFHDMCFVSWNLLTNTRIGECSDQYNNLDIHSFCLLDRWQMHWNYKSIDRLNRINNVHRHTHTHRRTSIWCAILKATRFEIVNLRYESKSNVCFSRRPALTGQLLPWIQLHRARFLFSKYSPSKSLLYTILVNIQIVLIVMTRWTKDIWFAD